MIRETQQWEFPPIKRYLTIIAMLAVVCAVSFTIATTLDDETVVFAFAVFVVMLTAWSACFYMLTPMVLGTFVGTFVGLVPAYALMFVLVA